MTARVLPGELPGRTGGKLLRDKGAARRRSKGAQPFAIPEDRHDLKVQGMIRARPLFTPCSPDAALEILIFRATVLLVTIL